MLKGALALWSEYAVTAFDFGPKFEPGTVVITQGAKQSLPAEDVAAALKRHWRGDWGELEHPDRVANEQALQDGGRLVSVYRSQNGFRFYIITEWDRSYTTILLPEEY